MSENTILALTNNFEKAKECGDKFFGKSKVDSSQNRSSDKLYTWNYNYGSNNLKVNLYGGKEEEQYSYSNKNLIFNISCDNSLGAIVLLDLSDNMAFKFLIENVEKIWDELGNVVPVAVLSFWDLEKLKKSTDNAIYVPNVTYGGSMETICGLVCGDLSKKSSEKDFKVFFKALDKKDPSLDNTFIEYLIN